MDNKSGFYGLLTLVLVGAILLGTHQYFPSLFSAILTVGIIIVVLILALVALVLFLAFHKPKTEKTADTETKVILSKGRTNLMELRRLGLSVRNMEVRALNDQICSSIDKILQTLKEQPEQIPTVRKFFNYYLPTLGGILSKYVHLENSGVPNEETTQNVISCLKDIKIAMEKQYNSLFDNDILDLSVEMEVLTAVCKRDGLLSEESDDNPESPINLIL